MGYRCLYNNKNGYENTAVGRATLYNTIGHANVALGYESLFSNNDGSHNVALGFQALYSNIEGVDNIAIGTQALKQNVGIDNIGIGYQTLLYNSIGYYNTALGSSALLYNTENFNTANGEGALYFTTTGSYNTATGSEAGENITDGSYNTFVGYYANCGSGGHLTNGTAIGNQASVTSNNHVVIGNSSVTSIGGYVNWSNLSDGRVKKNIKQNVPGLAFIKKLQPITYNLDLDAADKIIDRPQLKDRGGKIIQPSQFDIDARKAKEQIFYTGFVAQDVEKAAKDLDYDFSGVDKPDNANTLYGLRYSDFVVPLVKAVQELSEQNDSLNLKMSEFENLKIENEQLEQRIAKLEAMMNASQPTVNGQQSTVIASASLSQNIPNPFSNSTTISYSIPQQFSSAKIIITDKNGNTLKQINLSNNKGSVNIGAATLSSGAYQYSLYVDGKLIDTKQMIVIK